MLIDVAESEARALRFHGLCGDELGVSREGGINWYARLSQSATHDRLVFTYRASAYPIETLILHLCVPDQTTLSVILDLTNRLKFQTAEAKWRPMASRFGHHPSPNEIATQIAEFSFRNFVGARRPVHPSQVVDRLIMQERNVTMKEIDALLQSLPSRER